MNTRRICSTDNQSILTHQSLLESAVTFLNVFFLFPSPFSLFPLSLSLHFCPSVRVCILCCLKMFETIDGFISVGLILILKKPCTCYDSMQGSGFFYCRIFMYSLPKCYAKIIFVCLHTSVLMWTTCQLLVGRGRNQMVGLCKSKYKHLHTAF